MKKIIFFLFVTFISIVNVSAAELTPNAKSAILLEYSTGKILYKKNENSKLAPASMTKLMTLLLIMETIEEGNLKMSDSVLISENAAKMGGSQIFLEPNSNMKVEELIKGIAIASGNDAAVAMAEKIGGTEEEFVNMMNQKAQALNLKNTHFSNVHGLDAENHYSSAYDMAMIAKELLKYEDILKYTSIYEEYLNKPDGSRTWLVNTNKLVRFYDGVDGLKTGYTKEAGYCLTSTAKKNNVRYITVVMGEPTSDQRTTDTTNLLNYAFNNYKLNTILKKDIYLGKIKIEKGEQEFGTLTLLNDLTELLKNTEKTPSYTQKIHLEKVTAPIKYGDQVGKLELLDENSQVIKTVPITIKETINKTNFFSNYLKIIKEILRGKATI